MQYANTGILDCALQDCKDTIYKLEVELPLLCSWLATLSEEAAMAAALAMPQHALGRLNAAGASWQAARDHQPKSIVTVRPSLQGVVTASPLILQSNCHQSSFLTSRYTPASFQRIGRNSFRVCMSAGSENPPDPDKSDPALWSSEELGEYLAEKTGVSIFEISGDTRRYQRIFNAYTTGGRRFGALGS